MYIYIYSQHVAIRSGNKITRAGLQKKTKKHKITSPLGDCDLGIIASQIRMPNRTKIQRSRVTLDPGKILCFWIKRWPPTFDCESYFAALCAKYVRSQMTLVANDPGCKVCTVRSRTTHTFYYNINARERSCCVLFFWHPLLRYPHCSPPDMQSDPTTNVGNAEDAAPPQQRKAPPRICRSLLPSLSFALFRSPLQAVALFCSLSLSSRTCRSLCYLSLSFRICRSLLLSAALL